MSRKGNPQLIDLVLCNIVSTTGYVFLKYKDTKYSAKLNENGEIVYKGKMKFDSPSAYGKYIFNLKNTCSEGRPKQCAGWNSVRYSHENDFLKSRPLRHFREQFLASNNKKTEKRNDDKEDNSSSSDKNKRKKILMKKPSDKRTPPKHVKKKRKKTICPIKPLDIDQIKLVEKKRMQYVARKAKFCAERVQAKSDNSTHNIAKNVEFQLPSLNSIGHNKAVYDVLKEKFKCRVGFSDHSLDNKVAMAAVASGAEIIEKHIALNNQKTGLDLKFSLNLFNYIQ